MSKASGYFFQIGKHLLFKNQQVYIPIMILSPHTIITDVKEVMKMKYLIDVVVMMGDILDKFIK